MAAGVAEYFDLDPTMVRLVFVLAALLAGQLDIGVGTWRVLRFSWPIALITIGSASLLAGPRRH